MNFSLEKLHNIGFEFNNGLKMLLSHGTYHGNQTLSVIQRAKLFHLMPALYNNQTLSQSIQKMNKSLKKAV